MKQIKKPEKESIEQQPIESSSSESVKDESPINSPPNSPSFFKNEKLTFIDQFKQISKERLKENREVKWVKVEEIEEPLSKVEVESPI